MKSREFVEEQEYWKTTLPQISFRHEPHKRDQWEGVRRVETGCRPQGHRLIRLGRQQCVWLSKQACDYAKYRTDIKTVLLASFCSRPPGHHWAQVCNVPVTFDMVMRGTFGQRLTDNKLNSNGEPPEHMSQCGSKIHRSNSIFPTRDHWWDAAGGSGVTTSSTKLHWLWPVLALRNTHTYCCILTSSLTCHEDEQNWCFMKLNRDSTYSHEISIKTSK